MYTYYPNQKQLIWCGAFGGGGGAAILSYDHQ